MRNGRMSLLAAACLVAAGATAQVWGQAAVRQVAYVKASNTSGGLHFGGGGTLEGHGLALSADGRTMAVGAIGDSSGAKGINGDQKDTSAYESGAVYVFTGGPGNWKQEAYIKASNPDSGDRFGHMVALSADGNTLAVSAHFEASNATGINGNQADNSIMQAGAVYVFVRRGSTWSQQAYIKASNTGEAGTADTFGDGDQFGFSLAISGDGNTIAVGANAEDSGATGINGDQKDNSKVSAGAVYVFTRSGAAWSQQAYVKPTNTDGNDQFGYSVSLTTDGNMLAIGSYDEDSGSRGVDGGTDRNRPGSGAVYVFGRTGTTWAQQSHLKVLNAERNDSVGVAVTISADGNTLLVGSVDEDCLVTGVNQPGCDTDIEKEMDTSTGAAYVFVRKGGKWAQEAFIKASNTGQDDTFGSRLTMSADGSTLAIAAPLEDGGAKGINGNDKDNTASEAGAVYLFRRAGGQWAQQAYLKGSNTEAFDEFGGAVALSRDGSVLAVGARSERGDGSGVNANQADNSAEGAGAVYVFTVGR